MAASVPSKLGARRRRRRRILAIAAGILGLFLLAAFVFLFRLQVIQVQAIDVVGAATVSPDEVRAATEEGLAGNYLWVFPKRNIFFYPRHAIEAKLLGQFPRLATANLSFENFHTIKLAVTERKLYALWCGVAAPASLPADSQAFTCDFVDENGLIFLPAADFTGTPYLRYFGEEATTTGRGEPYLAPAEFKRLDAFLHALTQFSLTATGAALMPDNDATVYLGSGAKLLISRSDYADMIQKVRAALASDVFDAKHPIESLNYLDLRFGDKVYYTFR